MNGVLVVDKPPGPTSHDVVMRVRRAIGEKRIGHTGTLDPLATGVLPLVIGRATRLAALLSTTDKEYVADIRLGAATPTYDAEARIQYDRQTGTMTITAPPPPAPVGVTAGDIERLMAGFRGSFMQVPPVFSAKKIAGMAAFKRARRNQRIGLEPVEVTVRELVLEDYDCGLLRVRLTSSAGFYVRTLAHELGQRLGCGAHLEGLRRVRAAGYGLEDAVALGTIEERPAAAVDSVIPLARLLPMLPGAVLTEQGARRVAHGNPVSDDDFVFAGHADEGGRVRLLDAEGKLIAIAERRGGVLHPVIVLV